AVDTLYKDTHFPGSITHEPWQTKRFLAVEYWNVVKLIFTSQIAHKRAFILRVVVSITFFDVSTDFACASYFGSVRIELQFPSMEQTADMGNIRNPNDRQTVTFETCIRNVPFSPKSSNLTGGSSSFCLIIVANMFRCHLNMSTSNVHMKSSGGG
ncbi:hypothetical protein L9F63_000898, partial [Diploptera punctata]